MPEIQLPARLYGPDGPPLDTDILQRRIDIETDPHLYQVRFDDLRRLRREGAEQNMTPSDDERYLESRLAEMDRRLDPHQGAAEDDDLPVLG